MKGFTLIELLVVVIIIGILAAIALPQYELVVEKSRAAEAMINAKAIQDAMQRHEQEFPGEKVSNCTQISDVQLKGGQWQATMTEKCKGATSNFVYTTSNFYYDLQGGDACSGGSNNTYFTVCRKNANGVIYAIHYPRLPGSRPVAVSGCAAGTDYEQVCKLFTDI